MIKVYTYKTNIVTTDYHTFKLLDKTRHTIFEEENIVDLFNGLTSYIQTHTSCFLMCRRGNGEDIRIPLSWKKY